MTDPKEISVSREIVEAAEWVQLPPRPPFELAASQLKGISFVNLSPGWKVPRIANPDGIVTPEEEARAAEQERALNAGEIRPAWWTDEDEPPPA